MHLKYLIIITLSLLSLNMQARVGSSPAAIEVIDVETDKFRVIHCYDNTFRFSYSSKSKYTPYSVFEDNCNPNSFILLYDKVNGDTLFKRACPEFDSIVVDEEQGYISCFMETNSIHSHYLGIFDFKGGLMFYHHFIDWYIEMDTDELRKLSLDYPNKFYRILECNYLSLQANGNWKINFDALKLFKESDTYETLRNSIISTPAPHEQSIEDNNDRYHKSDRIERNAPLIKINKKADSIP